MTVQVYELGQIAGTCRRLTVGKAGLCLRVFGRMFCLWFRTYHNRPRFHYFSLHEGVSAWH
jgi:hypothetical protein